MWHTYLSECHGHSGDSVHVGATLERGEDGRVDLLLIVVFQLLALFVYSFDSTPEEDEATPVDRLDEWKGNMSWVE